jgi:hypothetical protein
MPGLNNLQVRMKPASEQKPEAQAESAQTDTEQDPPKVYPSGFIMPGNRHVVIESQSNLPTYPPNK